VVYNNKIEIASVRLESKYSLILSDSILEPIALDPLEPLNSSRFDYSRFNVPQDLDPAALQLLSSFTSLSVDDEDPDL